jgi:hypothetical protein
MLKQHQNTRIIQGTVSAVFTVAKSILPERNPRNELKYVER